LLSADPIDVVFVHGIRSSARAWDTFIRLIKADPELGAVVRPHPFEYSSRLFNLRPDRRIPDIDDIADRLDTYLSTPDLVDAGSIVLVTHSQGGLIVQRSLIRMLRAGRGHELARIKQISMFACPNSGSQFLLPLRRLPMIRRNPQVKGLRPLDRMVTETQQALLHDVVHAVGVSANQCHIPISSYGGVEDKIVPPHIAKSFFIFGGTVTGDHSTIIRPKDANTDSYQVLRRDLLVAAGAEAMRPLGADEASERQGRVSVTPPFGSREGELHGRAEIIRAIMSDTASRVHVLAGLGGAGKSRIALEIAERAGQAGRQVWWVSLARINGRMRKIAYQLAIPESRIELEWSKGGSPTDLVWSALDARKKPWLLIFDNADDPAELGPAGGRVADGTGWLRAPKGGNGMVIVTTRDSNPSTWGQWCTMHLVRPLESPDGAAMLMDLVGPGGGTREQARRLSDELGGLPLALHAAAKYVNSERDTGQVWAGATGIRNLDEYRAAVVQRFGSAPGALAPGRAPTESLGLRRVQQVFEFSLRLLAERGLPESEPLLGLLACLSSEPIPYHVLLTDAVLGKSALLPDFTTARRNIVLRGLADLGLIDLDELPGVEDPDLSHVLSLHPVVHGLFRDGGDVRRKRAEYYSLNLQALLAATQGHDPDYPEGWHVWHLLVPHTREVCRATLLGPTHLIDQRVIVPALELARMTCRYLIVAGLIGPADDLVAEIIANCESFGFSADDREILALRHERGRIAIERGDPGAAESELRDVVDGRSAILGERHHDTLASRHKLAKAILDQSRWREAEALLASIVGDEQDVRGPEHSDTMVVRHSLARAIYAQGGRHTEAETMLREILKVRLRLWSPTTPETLFVRRTLARCLLDQGKTQEAEAEIDAALALVADRPDVLVILQLRGTKATVLLALGQLNEAVTELTRLVVDREKMLGPDHPETHRARQLLDEVRKRLFSES
jgi:hypothetical protein